MILFNVYYVYADTGKILKVVFSKSNSQPPTFDPVVAEEITVKFNDNSRTILLPLVCHEVMTCNLPVIKTWH